MASPYATFAAGVLRGIGAPVTPQNIAGFIGWSQAEGPLGSSNWQRNNPLNTTEPSGASSTLNSAGVRAYPNLPTGVAATVKTLKNGNYGGIVSAFRSNNPHALAPAIGASPWGTSGQLASQTIQGALGKNWGAPGSTLPGPSGTGFTTKRVMLRASSPATVFDQAGFQKAQQAQIAGSFLRSNQASPFDIGPKIPGLSSPSFSLASLFPSQAPNPADFEKTTMLKSARSTLERIAGQKLTAHPGESPSGQGDVNPLANGWTLTETDQGVDATAKPGTPILAMNDSRVVSVTPNWYAGQPFVVMQILNGPNRGKFWYVSEQVTGYHPVGTVVRRGQPVAQFASSGTGIEIGWASGRPGQTLTQAQTPQLVAGRHVHGTPQGIDFSKRVVHHAPVSVS